MYIRRNNMQQQHQIKMNCSCYTYFSCGWIYTKTYKFRQQFRKQHFKPPGYWQKYLFWLGNDVVNSLRQIRKLSQYQILMNISCLQYKDENSFLDFESFRILHIYETILQIETLYQVVYIQYNLHTTTSSYLSTMFISLSTFSSTEQFISILVYY